MNTRIRFETNEELISEIDRVEKVYGDVVIPTYLIDWTTKTIEYEDGDPLDCPYARKFLRGDYD